MQHTLRLNNVGSFCAVADAGSSAVRTGNVWRGTECEVKVVQEK